MTDILETLVDTDEAARVLTTKPQTLEKWRRDGSGPAYIKVGRLVRYRPSALTEYLARRTIAPRDAAA